MKKICLILLTLALVLSASTSFRCTVSAEVGISAQSAILIDADSGMIMHEKNAYERMGMASTTKIMTALVTVHLMKPDMTVSIPKEAVGTEGSSVYLCEGEKMTVEQLLYALLLASANDAAVALAIAASGSIEKFADQMNMYAEKLGLHDTHFVNPHGLYDEDHYTTAYDLALISRAALADPLLTKIFSTYKKELPCNGEENKRLVVNHNKLLRTYEGAVGMKTGYTKSTGRCLVSAAQRNGLTLICVTLNAPDDWKDHTSLLDYGFENYTRYVFAEAGEFEYSLPLVGGESDSVTLINVSPISFTVKKGEEGTVLYTVESTYRFLYAPALRGYVCGQITVECGGVTKSSSLYVTKTVAATEAEKGFWQKIIDFLKKD